MVPARWKASKPPEVTARSASWTETVPADVVVVVMGPWTHRASTWAPGMPKVILGQKYHAVLMRPERVLTQAVFFQGLGDPEFYPRGDGDVYECAYPDSPNVVDEEPGEVEVRPDAVQRLVDVAKAVSSEMKNAEVNGSQSCHLPITQDGMPVMGAVPGTNGLYVATGHSCWGILNSPASGAELAPRGASVPHTASPRARPPGQGPPGYTARGV